LVPLKISPKLAGFAVAWFAVLTGIPAFAAGPLVSVSTTAATFVSLGGSVPAPQNVTVTSAPTVLLGSYSVSYSTLGNWLTVFPPNFSPPQAAPVTFNLYVTPGSLPAGLYAAQVSFNVVGGNAGLDPASATSFGVFLSVGGGGGGTLNQTITVAPASLGFTYQPGGTLPLAQAVTVATSDSSTVSITAQTNDGGKWLVFSAPTLATPGTLNISVNPSSLATGTYSGNVTVTGTNNVTQIPVTFAIGSAGLNADPGSLTISEPQNYGLSAYQPLRITASSPSSVQVNASTVDGNWLQVDQNNATTPATIGVRANNSGLAQGTYQGTISVQSGPTNVVSVPITLTVGAPAVLSLSPANLTFNYQIADPTPAALSVRVGSLNSSVQTFTVVASTSDGGKWLLAGAAPTSTPGAVSVAVDPTGLAVGTYTGIVNVLAGITNASPQPILVTLLIKPAPLPTVQSVTSAASYASGIVAPGEIVTIFGANIGPKTLTLPPSGTVPTTVSSTSVTFDGIPAPIYYASGTQTSVQVPYGIAMGQTLMKVTYNTAVSVGTTLKSQLAFPGLFTANSAGTGQAAALNGDLSVNSASNPATRGQVLVLYGTGEGQTSPPSVEGVKVPTILPFPQTALPVTVTIGGQTVQLIQYVGETPGLFSGLLQINVVVPNGSPVGPAIPVQVTINGQPTQANVTVAIQ
jgi:uncharacterized protein (TIGR03437 family)